MFTDNFERHGSETENINSIHLNALRILVYNLIPQVAGLAPDSECWLQDFKMLTLASVDHAGFTQAGGINPDMMKAAVIGSLEETFAGAEKILQICNLSGLRAGDPQEPVAFGR